MAHTKAQKTVKGNRDSRSKRLGVKVFGNQDVNQAILLFAKGTKVNAGPGTLLGRDFTIMAKVKGKSQFYKNLGNRMLK